MSWATKKYNWVGEVQCECVGEVQCECVGEVNPKSMLSKLMT